MYGGQGHKDLYMGDNASFAVATFSCGEQPAKDVEVIGVVILWAPGARIVHIDQALNLWTQKIPSRFDILLSCPVGGEQRRNNRFQPVGKQA